MVWESPRNRARRKHIFAKSPANFLSRFKHWIRRRQQQDPHSRRNRVLLIKENKRPSPDTIFISCYNYAFFWIDISKRRNFAVHDATNTWPDPDLSIRSLIIKNCWQVLGVWYNDILIRYDSQCHNERANQTLFMSGRGPCLCWRWRLTRGGHGGICVMNRDLQESY